MGIIDINKYKEKITLKKKIIIAVILILIIAVVVSVVLYIKNESFRNWADEYIFRKNIEDSDILYIEIDSSNNPSVYAYDKYITILEKNILSLYTSSGNKVQELEINISNPIYAGSGKYLCIAENGGNEIYVISGDSILWQTSVENSISQVDVNKNGYVSITEKGTSYKNIIVIFNNDGKELFKTYLSSSMAIATDISSDNKYLAIAEVDTSGAIIKSNVKIISVDKAENDPTNSVEYSIAGNDGDLITNIKYQDKDKLVCIYDTGVHVIENGEDSCILEFGSNAIMADIENSNGIVYAEEISNGIFSTSTNIIIRKVQSDSVITYEVDSTIKTLQVYDNNIAINLGSEAHFINTSGWLQKKYNSGKEISEIVLGESIAGIVYRDKVEIINL